MKKKKKKKDRRVFWSILMGYDEPDDDKPGARLYRSVQRWVVEIHEES